MTTPAYRIARNIRDAADGWVLDATRITMEDERVATAPYIESGEAGHDPEDSPLRYRVAEPERFEAYWNQAPDQKGGRVYALFAFRSTVYAQDMASAQTRRNTEELELYVFARIGRADAGRNMAEAELSEQRLAELIARLGSKVVSVGGLETGANDQGYHFARRRIVIGT